MFNKTWSFLFQDVRFEMDFNDETLVGDPIKVNLKITNTSSNTRTVSGTLNVCSAYYTGNIHTSVRKQAIKDMVLKAKEGKRFDEEILKSLRASQ